ncbi:uroporphyrinogen-III C-methyltransferase [Agromyces intestinalis]|uniref:uroporphyrinogen-III C-methyltransferase n=1 Tax=Agromyces intestinalis TaxID=2592652 RepID=A0A5C1YIE1_9MICO|nr:uroporphyrinogen-III C-methyltransferase [Agromyces intestinalis]QEO15741.1 uroporphyrinogen-III C-methyltransferase [Agromyces intestinalis]
MSAAAPAGRVTLVGGGPGDPDLLTVRAVRALADADVVLYDRLAPHTTLAELAPRATLIDVGKRPGHHAVPQHEIDALLVEHARTGAHVVRLKGGDPYVFGRGGEEVLACRAAGIPVTVVPGVSSAVAVPSAAGIPLTHRGVSHLFTVVSGHAPLTDDELDRLAGLGGTIVVLMGVNTLPSLAAGLLRHGLDRTTPVAIVERGTRPDQRTTIAPLDGIVVAAGIAHAASPAVIVIGEVVGLASAGEAHALATIDRAGALGVEP